jgi:hypothetical protein
MTTLVARPKKGPTLYEGMNSGSIYSFMWPERAPQAPRSARGLGAQYKMLLLPCREASACLFHPSGMSAWEQAEPESFTVSLRAPFRI